jgi:hypothetical protein
MPSVASDRREPIASGIEDPSPPSLFLEVPRDLVDSVIKLGDHGGWSTRNSDSPNNSLLPTGENMDLKCRGIRPPMVCEMVDKDLIRSSRSAVAGPIDILDGLG